MTNTQNTPPFHIDTDYKRLLDYQLRTSVFIDIDTKEEVCRTTASYQSLVSGDHVMLFDQIFYMVVSRVFISEECIRFFVTKELTIAADLLQLQVEERADIEIINA